MGRWGWWWGGGDKNTEGTNERTTGMGIACPPNIPLSPLYHILKLHENLQNNRWYWSCRIQKIVLHTKQKNFKDRPEETKTTARAAILRFGDTYICQSRAFVTKLLLVSTAVICTQIQLLHKTSALVGGGHTYLYIRIDSLCPLSLPLHACDDELRRRVAWRTLDKWGGVNWSDSAITKLVKVKEIWSRWCSCRLAVLHAWLFYSTRTWQCYIKLLVTLVCPCNSSQRHHQSLCPSS